MLPWKLASFAVGLGFALLGIALNSAVLLNLAIGVVLVGVALRLLSRDRSTTSESTHRRD